MDFNNVEVIATTKNCRRRLMREAIEIEKNKTVNTGEAYDHSSTWKKLLRKTVTVNGSAREVYKKNVKRR